MRLSANIIDSHLTNIINSDLLKDSFSEDAKTASVRPIFKKKERDKIENYRPVSILNCFSKIYEKFLLEAFKPFIDTFLSEYIAAYREHYSSNHVLIRLIENWKKALDEKFFVGAVLMDLSKAFDCIPHDLLIAKLHAYGFSEKTVTFIYSYLKRRKQNVKIENFYSDFLTLLSGVPQGSILGPILFNLFLNDLLATLKMSELYNFADDNTISTASKNMSNLIQTLEKESETAVDWFNQNKMIVNPEKFQAMLLQKRKENNQSCLKINNQTVKTTNCVKLLGINIDSEVNFDSHISDLCKKASVQLNALYCLRAYIRNKKMKILINSFIYSNYNYCPLVWHFSSCKSTAKIEKIHKRCLRMILNDNTSDYQALLEKSKKPSMEIKRLRNLATEIFKTVNNLNPSFMKNISTSKEKARVCPNNIVVKSHNSATYGDKSLVTLRPKIWNALPEKIKSETSYKKLKKYIDLWFGSKCRFNICKSLYN